MNHISFSGEMWVKDRGDGEGGGVSLLVVDVILRGSDAPRT